MPEYDDAFEDPTLECDPECDKNPVAPEGRYTNSEHGARILSMGPRTFDTKRGPVTYLDINVIIPDVPNVGSVFARSEAFGKYNTQTTKGAGSMAKAFLAQLGNPKKASDAENMAVVVEVGVNSYVAKEDQLTPEEREQGMEPRITEKNIIKNIMVE